MGGAAATGAEAGLSRLARISRPQRQLAAFAAIGTAGVAVDTSLLHVCVHLLGVGLLPGRLLSFLGAVTFNWACNRAITFRRQRSRRRLAEWARFIGVNAVGGTVNLLVYAALVSAFATVRAYPVLGVAAGTLAGFGFNFLGSRRLVFAGPPARTAATSAPAARPARASARPPGAPAR